MLDPEINTNPTMSKPTKRSNILIGLIKLCLIVIIIVAAYFIYSSISDNNNQELNCSDPNQDGSNRIYVCPQGKTLKLPPDGNLCAGDTCTDTDCCVDIPIIDSSSVRICQRPSTSVLNNYNMTNVQENNLNMDSFDVTGITCNDSYSGEAVATVCTRPGGHYNVTGCTSSVTDLVGSVGGSGNNCGANEPDITGKHISTISTGTCQGTATDTYCDHTCDTGYEGGYVICRDDGQYAVEPCTPIVGNCAANEPDITGKHIGTIPSGACDGTATDAMCGHACITNDYGQGSVTCLADGTWRVEPCRPLHSNCDGDVPDVTNGFMDTDSCTGTAVGDTCIHTCNNGYTGGSVTCRADGAWVVEPCIVDNCVSISCGNGAICQSTESGYTCTCDSPLYTGEETINEPATCTSPLGDMYYLGEIGESCSNTCDRNSKICTNINALNSENFFTSGAGRAVVDGTICDGIIRTPYTEATPYYDTTASLQHRCAEAVNGDTAPTCGAVSTVEGTRRFCHCTHANCGTNEPVIAGESHINAISSGACNNTAAGGMCLHTCADGYEGGSVTCRGSDGQYAVEPCTAIVGNCAANEPDITGKHISTISTGACNGTATEVACHHTCDNGYYGGSVTCRGDGTWTVEPCIQLSTHSGSDNSAYLSDPYYLGMDNESCSEVCIRFNKSCDDISLNEAANYFNEGYPGNQFKLNQCNSASQAATNNNITPYYSPTSSRPCKHASGGDTSPDCTARYTDVQRICKCV